MGSIDVESFLQPIAGDNPCGPDLEYDPMMAELEEALRGKAEQQYGDTVIPAEEPDWSTARKRALELIGRSKDLRIGVSLCHAVLGQGNLHDFADATRILEGFVGSFWDNVYPELDVDDDNDPTSRVNALAAMCDYRTMVRLALGAPLVQVPALGALSLLDAQIASGEALAPPDMDEPPTTDTIDGAFLNVEISALQETAESIGQVLTTLSSIEQKLTDHVGASRAMSFENLGETFRAMDSLVQGYLSRRRSETEVDSESESKPESGESAATAQAPMGSPNEINSRQDVIKTIDRICEYYERFEPSSPVPLLLNRAKRLATKGFLDIIADLTPDALHQAATISGEKSSED